MSDPPPADAVRTEPVFNVPVVILAVLFALAAIHGLRVWGSPALDAKVLTHLSFMPALLSALLDPSGVAARGLDVPGTPAASLPTLLTYALLHGGWAHLGLNSIWLLAFGTPVARRFGPGRFLLFLGVAAIAGALAHWALFPFSEDPLVGASAAVSGCMGAAVRFAFHGSEPEDPGPDRRPALPLAATLRDRRTLSFLLAWFVSNAAFGAGSVSFGLSDQPVAWQAHVGGFLVGLLLFSWFDPVRPPAASAD